MKDIMRLAKQFRDAIDAARKARDFDKDLSFNEFPRGCCGDTSDLLAQYLLENGIETNYVCGTYRDGSFENSQTHAWLLTDNNIIIDITGDQFKYDADFLNYNESVYVGVEDDFHRLFEVEKRDCHDNYGVDNLGCFSQPRLNKLYRKIIKYI
ncbi:transglutaminase domain-containing protein [Clostridium sp. C2-6-12]|uniref:transglutaminase domain-containing protein n=1 Tax=Clostridium sp. C2-6-12 TaxID=2698832 RepID=UPI00136D411F|nr:transglutaminase domain-containing protein [Clostridium sp. C2-6-12]